MLAGCGVWPIWRTNQAAGARVRQQQSAAPPVLILAISAKHPARGGEPPVVCVRHEGEEEANEQWDDEFVGLWKWWQEGSRDERLQAGRPGSTAGRRPAATARSHPRVRRAAVSAAAGQKASARDAVQSRRQAPGRCGWDSRAPPIAPDPDWNRTPAAPGLCKAPRFAIFGRVNRLTRQEQYVLCIVLGLLLTGWAVKSYRTAHPPAAAKQGEGASVTAVAKTRP
jgi:hypothetical protein